MTCIALDVESEVHERPEVTFLGVSGFLIKWRNDALMIDPLFSRPGLFGLPPIWVSPDEKATDFKIPRVNAVSMLLVGHGHYDHLLDVPYIMRRHATRSIAYGSRTVGRILRAEIDECRIMDAEFPTDQLPQCTQGLAMRDGWFYSSGGGFRAMPIRSMHAPHIGPYTLASHFPPKGNLSRLPTTVFGWQEGQTLAWLIDLLDADGRQPKYRIHIQSSASDAPLGSPLLLDKKPVDVEIVSAALWDHVSNYPDALLAQTSPQLIILSHWDNFFGDSPGIMRGLDLEGLCKRIRTVAPKKEVKRLQPLETIYLDGQHESLNNMAGKNAECVDQ